MSELNFRPGDRVNHDVFGLGVICQVSTTHTGPAAYVQFDEARAIRNGEPKSHRNILVTYLSGSKAPVVENNEEPEV